MTDKPSPLPEAPQCVTGHHIDQAFEDMAGPDRIIHDFRVQARSEWDVLAALGEHLRDETATLRKLTVSRFGAGPVCVAFQCAGLRAPAVRELLECLEADRHIRNIRLEYVMARAETPSRSGS